MSDKPATEVVTSLIAQDQYVLLLQRSSKVRTYRGRWAGVSGYLEPKETPETQARREIREETGWDDRRMELVAQEAPLRVHDRAAGREWVVHPFLFRLAEELPLRLDREHEQARWLPVADLPFYPVVPSLMEVVDLFSGSLPKSMTPALSDSERESYRAIVEDRKRGAAELEREAVRLLRDAGGARAGLSPTAWLEELNGIGRSLMQARPAMRVMANGIRGILSPLQNAYHRNASTAELARNLGDSAEIHLAASQSAPERIAEHLLGELRERWSEPARVLTLSRSSTVIRALIAARERIDRVVVAESRPLNEGRRMAAQLAEAGIAATLITDAQLGLFAERTDMLAVGADSILADGTVLNKAGTFPAAACAQTADKPVLVLSETGKVAWWPGDEGYPGGLEEMDSTEVDPFPPAGVEVRNLYFDRTPPGLIARYVTEAGSLAPERLLEEARRRHEY